MKPFRFFYCTLTLLVLFIFSPVTVPAQNAKQKTIDQIAGRVKAAYRQTSGNRELNFTSKSYYRLWNAVKNHDSRLVGELGLFDYDHWYLSQDVDRPQVRVLWTKLVSSTGAKVKVSITDGGYTQFIIFPMVYERGNWYIDDFVTLFEGSIISEKKMMQQYIRENSISLR